MGLDQVVEGAPGLRQLRDVSLQASVERVLATLPDTARAAVVDVGADSQGVVAVGVVKLKGGWSVMGTLDKRFHGDWAGHVALRWADDGR